MKRRKYETKELREKIGKLVRQGFSYSEIADMLGLKSRQLVRYHFKKALDKHL